MDLKHSVKIERLAAQLPTRLIKFHRQVAAARGLDFRSCPAPPADRPRQNFAHRELSTRNCSRLLPRWEAMSGGLGVDAKRCFGGRHGIKILYKKIHLERARCLV